MSTFFCTKCGWSRRAREGDPEHVACGNPKCNYGVARNDQTPDEIRDGLRKNLISLYGWSEKTATAYINGVKLREGTVEVCTSILEDLVEAKMLKTKWRKAKEAGEPWVEDQQRYITLRDDAWARAFKWFGWDVDELIDMTPAKDTEIVHRLPADEEVKDA